MSTWIKLNPAEFAEAREQSVHGVKAELYLSPYDIPQAVKGSVDEENCRFRIQFRYIGGEEPLEVRDSANSVYFKIGRRSRRLYEIDFPIDPAKEKIASLQLVLTELEDIFKKLSTSLGAEKQRRAGNYEVAKKILSKRGEKVIKQAQAA